MRAFKRFQRGGFTLVELMIVVAIIGVLAALAIYGVRRYLQGAKTSEAKNSIGGIVRGGIAAYERETTVSEIVAEGASGSGFTNDLCGNAVPVPSAIGSVKGTKYQPNTKDTFDYATGSQTVGWKCLRFTSNSPQYFQVGYAANPLGTVTGAATQVLPKAPGPTTLDANSFMAWAQGDLDGDDVLSAFSMVATVNTTTKEIKQATQVRVDDEYE